MQSILCLLLTVVATILLVPVSVLFIQVVAALTYRQKREAVESSATQRVAVLIPAHNESSAVIPTILSIAPQLQPYDRLIVVADNCTDDTGAAAQTVGAEVIHRNDPDRRGKGYALDFGVKHLRDSPPDIVVIIDADCILAPNSLSHLRAACESSSRPAQALNLMHAPSHAPLKMRLAELAWTIKNHVRPIGYLQLNLPCQLMGTGMAISWSLIKDAPLATGHITEDIELGAALAKTGFPPIFCPSALVTSNFPSLPSSQISQRTRWERGHISLITSMGPQFVGHAIKKGDFKLFAMAIDLCVPPLALLANALACCLIASLLLAASTGSLLPAFYLAGVTLLFFCSILLAWIKFGRNTIGGGELILAPIYLFKKIPFYFQMIYKKQVEWVRTSREENKNQ